VTLPRGWEERAVDRRTGAPPALVLGYVALTEAEIDAGVRALAGARPRTPG
jgi:hypothetical protein